MNETIRTFIFKIGNHIVCFFNKAKDNHLDVYSAGAAFYIFISLIPFFIFLLSIVPYTPITFENIYSWTDMLPVELRDTIMKIAGEAYASTGFVLSVSVIMAVWSAGRGILYISKGLNEISGTKETRNYFHVRILSAAYTIIVIVFIVVMLILGLFGKRILLYISEHMHLFSGTVRQIFDYRILIIIGIMFILFLFFYKVLPNRPVNIVYQIPGAFLSAVGWYLFTRLFGVFTSIFGGFSMYGSMATVIATMLWLDFCMYILFICAEINYYIFNYFNRKKKEKSPS